MLTAKRVMQSMGRGAWTGVAERGSVGALYLFQFVCRWLGRGMLTVLLVPTVGYFLLTGPAVRRASRDYLRTLFAAPGGRGSLGHSPTWRDEFRQLYEFAATLTDSMVAWSRGAEGIRIDEVGTPHLLELVSQGRGGLLLGAHLGSTDMLRVLAGRTGITLNVLTFTRHMPRIHAFFSRLAPELELRLIHCEPGSINGALQVKAAIERGEFVGILADRVWTEGAGRSVELPFLGRPARFPLGPFLLQAALGCPMLLTLCVRTGAGSYLATTEPFAPATAVPRSERGKYAEELAARYAAALERACLRTPHQWFNFFSFWRDERVS